MSIAISEEHRELARVVRTFLTSHDARAESRAMLYEASERMPSFWKEMAELGWMGFLFVIKLRPTTNLGLFEPLEPSPHAASFHP